MPLDAVSWPQQGIYYMSTQAAESPTLALAAFAARLRFADLPPAVVRQAQRLVLDALGCGLYGSTLEPSGLLQEMLLGEGGPGSVTLWGRPERLSLLDAVLANGTAVTTARADDTHREAMIHSGAVLVPACLAMAERRGPLDGRTFLTAIVAGCEVGARVGLAAGFGMMRRGFEPAAYSGTFCAAAAAGRLLGLDAAAMRDALGIAGSLGAGLMGAQRGAMVLPLHSGRAAQGGLYGALLAERGFTGIRDVVEARYGGFVATLSDEPRWEPLTLGLGEDWQIAGLSFKPYPCGASTHTAIDCALRLRSALPALRPADIEGVVVATTAITKEHGGWAFDPAEGPGAARMSIAWCTAVALAKGRVAPQDFDGAALADPDLRGLARRVLVVVDPALDAAGPAQRHAVRMTLRTARGESHSAAAAYGKGSPELPLSDAELAAKFADLAGRVLGAERAAAVAEAVWSLPACADVGRLAQTLAVVESGAGRKDPAPRAGSSSR